MLDTQRQLQWVTDVKGERQAKEFYPLPTRTEGNTVTPKSVHFEKKVLIHIIFSETHVTQCQLRYNSNANKFYIL